MSSKPTIVADGVDFSNIDVAELVQNTIKEKRRGGTRCWGEGVDGKLKAYIEGCRKNVNHPEYSMNFALEQAQKHLGVRIKISAFRNHVLGKCSCFEHGQ